MAPKIACTETSQQRQQSLDIILKTAFITIKASTKMQAHYINNIRSKDISIAIGPAGTGKTYLAVACAVDALLKQQVERILLVRPAVEAGESLGFLPGDLTEKIDPYLRTLYDALHAMLGAERVNDLLEQKVIELAPLAYMRGRTLSQSFIILDEGQNTTFQQMKMFLTRIGFGSKAVITGDITQIDLAPRGLSSLLSLSHILKGIDDIQFTYFNNQDIVRHNLTQHIVKAYERFEQLPSTRFNSLRFS